MPGIHISKRTEGERRGGRGICNDGRRRKGSSIVGARTRISMRKENLGVAEDAKLGALRREEER